MSALFPIPCRVTMGGRPLSGAIVVFEPEPFLGDVFQTATGTTDELIYVSPKSGRAVSRRAGEPYRDKLLPLPGFLIGGKGGDAGDVLAALKLTGSFLEHHVFTPHDRRLPAARGRFIDRLTRSPPISGGIVGNDED